MSVVLDGSVIRLRGSCGAEDAEALLEMLQQAGGRSVDVVAAEHLHAAVLQVVLALAPPVAGPPGDAFLAEWLWPLFRPQTGR